MPPQLSPACELWLSMTVRLMVVKNRTRPRSDLRSSIELEHDLGCYRHLLTLYFSIVSSVCASDQTLKSRFFGLTPLADGAGAAADISCGVCDEVSETRFVRYRLDLRVRHQEGSRKNSTPKQRRTRTGVHIPILRTVSAIALCTHMHTNINERRYGTQLRPMLDAKNAFLSGPVLCPGSPRCL